MSVSSPLLRALPVRSKRSKARGGSSDGTPVFAAVVIALFVLTIAPLVFLVQGSLSTGFPGQPGATFTFEPVRQVFGTTEYLVPLRNSLLLAALAASISMAVVGVVCWLLARTDLPWRRVLATVIVLPIGVGPVILTMAWIGLLSPRGVGLANNASTSLWGGDLLDVYSFSGLLLVLIVLLSPFAFFFMYGSFQRFASDQEESARVHGAELRRLVRRISFPSAKAALLGGWVLLFTLAIQNLTVYALLSNRSQIPTIPNSMYRLVQSSLGANGTANVLAVLIIAPSLVVLGLHVWYTRRLGMQALPGRQTGPPGVKLGHWKLPMLAVVTTFVLIAVVAPIGSLLLSSFLRFQTADLSRELFTLANYQAVYETEAIRSALLVSVQLALVAATLGTVASLVLAYIASQRRGWLAALSGTIPVIMLAVPGFALGLGYLWASFINGSVRSFSGSILGMSIALMVAYLGFGTRILATALTQFGSAYEEAAMVAGKGVWTRLTRVVAPGILPSLISVWRLIAVLTFTEFNIVALLYSSTTVPVSVFMFLQVETQPTPSVYALGVCQVLLVGAIFAVSGLPNRVRRHR